MYQPLAVDFLLLLTAGSAPLAAQSMPARPHNPWPTRPNVAPSFAPCINYSYLPAVMGPCGGAVGSTIKIRLRRDLGAPAAMMSFKAVVSRGVPARVHTRVQGRGLNYVTVAPRQLCMQGGGTWETELVLADGRNLGVIGSYTPTNCPR